MKTNNDVNKNLNDQEEDVKSYSLHDEKVWNLFVKPGEITEMRILEAFGKSHAWDGYAKGTVSGYFDNHADFNRCLEAADKTDNAGIYFTLQVIDPRLIGRALNRLKAADKTTSDNNVLFYRWLPVDIDPLRPSGVSSSASELERAMVLREAVAEWIVSHMELDEPIRAMSGNGGHLLFRLPDMPVDERSKSFLQTVLQGLDVKFSNDAVSIDTSVFNPARIWKAYGSTARKGDPVPGNEYREARPHRMSFIESLGRCS